MPNTCRYNTTASSTKLKRGGSITFYANSEDEKSERYLDVNRFIQENRELPKRKMGRKDRVLLWGVNNCIWINRVYALLSKSTKRLK